MLGQFRFCWHLASKGHLIRPHDIEIKGRMDHQFHGMSNIMGLQTADNYHALHHRSRIYHIVNESPRSYPPDGTAERSLILQYQCARYGTQSIVQSLRG